MLRFYWRLVKCTPSLLWRSITEMDKIVGALSLTFAAVGFVTWQEVLPWWSPFAAFALILFYGFLRTNYEEYLVVEGERNQLRETQETPRKRIAAKDLLAKAAEKGETLADVGVYPHERKLWVENTYELIEAAFGKSEARHFITDDSSNMYRPSNPYALGVRLKRLDELIVRAEWLSVHPNFNPHEWEKRFTLE